MKKFYRLNGRIVTKVCDKAKGTCKYIPVKLDSLDSPVGEIVIEDL